MTAASAPSASTQLELSLRPTSRAIVENCTPVHSEELSRPCVPSLVLHVDVFRQYLYRTVLEADLARDRRELHAGPFRGAEQAMRALHGFQSRLVPFSETVARALNEVLAGHRRKPLEVRHREFLRRIDH